MPKCPYEPTITDQLSDQVVTNPKYEYFMEGFEAHKLEMLQQSRRIELVLQKNLEYTIALAKSMQEVQALKKELTQKLAQRL